MDKAQKIIDTYLARVLAANVIAKLEDYRDKATKRDKAGGSKD